MVEKRKPVSSLLTRRASKTRIRQKKKAMTVERRYPVSSGILRSIRKVSLHALFVTTANINDRAGALEMFMLHREHLSEVENALADGGYSGENFAEATKEILSCSVEIAKRNELHTFSVMPKRWGVERSFAWLDKCPRPAPGQAPAMEKLRA